MREKVLQAFQLKKRPSTLEETTRLLTPAASLSERKAQLLLYPHNTVGEAGKRRAWLDIEDVFTELQTGDVSNNFETKMIRDFAKISVEEQASLFHHADVLIMSHGGQMGNTIFSRPNTVVIEVTCGSYSQMATGQAKFSNGLQFFHMVYSPCDCDSHEDRGNYNLPVAEIKRVLSFMAYSNLRRHGTIYERCK
mmetsp:Transcript_11800/g.14688  ORF Transcript_11800/g.14688 Transcript_11800/m.14688 type:complete len:194 (+) Transcript_11800:1-582(+)